MYSIVLATMVTAGSAVPSHGYFSCHGCYGCVGNAFSSCYGCGSCYGWGCYGWGGYGCSCYGWYGYPGYYGYWSGCYGCYGQCQGCAGCFGGVVIAPAVVAPAALPAPPPMKKAESAATSARVTLMLPEGARLFVNDVPVEVGAAARTFETPALPPGRPYHYVFKAEMQRDGQMIRDVQRVEVAAGKEIIVEFKGLPPVAAARR